MREMCSPSRCALQSSELVVNQRNKAVGVGQKKHQRKRKKDPGLLFPGRKRNERLRARE